MTFGSILAFVLQRSLPTMFDISPDGYAILAFVLQRSLPTMFDISPGGFAILAILLVNSNIWTLPVQLNIKMASVSK